jgi:D-amino peptidase
MASRVTEGRKAALGRSRCAAIVR